MDLISKEDLAAIVKLSESVPESFQKICFEILLQNSLGGKSPPSIPQDKVSMQKAIYKKLFA